MYAEAIAHRILPAAMAEAGEAAKGAAEQMQAIEDPRRLVLDAASVDIGCNVQLLHCRQHQVAVRWLKPQATTRTQRSRERGIVDGRAETSHQAVEKSRALELILG